MKQFIILIIFCVPLSIQAQQQEEALRKEILELRADVENIQINLVTGEKKFKQGIFVATLGYSITIAGGLMLGRANDDLGKVLLVTGGATGITGTAMMLDAFKYLGRAGKPKRNK